MNHGVWCPHENMERVSHLYNTKESCSIYYSLSPALSISEAKRGCWKKVGQQKTQYEKCVRTVRLSKGDKKFNIFNSGICNPNHWPPLFCQAEPDTVIHDTSGANHTAATCSKSTTKQCVQTGQLYVKPVCQYPPGSTGRSNSLHYQNCLCTMFLGGNTGETLFHQCAACEQLRSTAGRRQATKLHDE